MAGLSKNAPDTASSNEQGKTYSKNTKKPDGDACREDGMLKDTDEMVWLNSPSDEVEVTPWNKPDSQDGIEQNDLQSAIVSMQIGFLAYMLCLAAWKPH